MATRIDRDPFWRDKWGNAHDTEAEANKADAQPDDPVRWRHTLERSVIILAMVVFAAGLVVGYTIRGL